MAGKSQSDNFYRRQQEEANRIATAQSRTMNDIARLAKSQAEELRKLRRAFEEFAKAVLDIKTVRPFQIDAASADAAKLEMTNGDIPPEEAAANAMRAAGLGEPEFDAAAFRERIGQPYPKVDIAPKGKPKARITRLGYGDVTEKPSLNPDTLITVWPGDEPAVNPNPANARVMRRADAERLGYTQIIHDPEVDVEGSELDEAIQNGEHPPAMFEVPEVAPVKTNRDGTRSYIKQEVLPPGVTPKMMEEHPEFAERVRNSPHYHQANQDASQRAKREGGLASY